MSDAATLDASEQDGAGFWRVVRIGAVIAVVIVAVMALAAIVSELTATEDTARFVVDDPVDAIHIETVGGHVTVVGTDIENVEVVRSSHYSIIEPDGRADVEGMTLTLTDGCTRSVLLIPNCTVDFEVRASADTAIVVHGERTDVTIVGIEGSMNIETTAADIALTDTSGPITVEAEGSDLTSAEIRGPGATIMTTDGSILLDYLDQPGVIAARTTVGPVRVVVPQGRYAIDVKTGDGEAEVSVIDDPTSDRRISVTNSIGDVVIDHRP